MADTEAIAAKTYQRALGAGFKADDEHKRRLEFEARAGRLRGWIWYGNQTPQAFWIGFLYGDTFHSSWTGFDPELGNLRIGNLMLIELIDRLAAEKVKTFDFGLGDADYKQRFGDKTWNDVTISAFRPSMRGWDLNGVFGLGLAVQSLAKSVATRLNIAQRIKRFWRRKAAASEAEE